MRGTLVWWSDDRECPLEPRQAYLLRPVFENSPVGSEPSVHCRSIKPPERDTDGCFAQKVLIGLGQLGSSCLSMEGKRT